MKWLSCLLFVCILFCSGCSQSIKKIVAEPVNKKADEMSYEFVRALAIMVKSHFDTGDKTIDDIMFDLELAEYKLSIVKE